MPIESALGLSEESFGGSQQMTQKTEKPRVVDFQEIREKKLEEKRRKNERVFFKNMLGIYSVMENEKIRPIEIIDLSEDGLSFQVPFSPEDPWPKDLKSVPIRFYFSQDSYLPLVLEIKNSRPCISEGSRYIRYGCKIDQTVSTFEAFQQFVRFLKLYSEHSHQDQGGTTLFYL